MDRTVAERWYQLSVGEQISNIGSEVHRAIRFKNKNDEKLIDYFIGDNIYQTTDEMLIKFYDSFL